MNNSTDTSSSTNNIAVTKTCYDGRGSSAGGGGGKLCIDAAEVTSKYSIICSAQLNGIECSSCAYFPNHACYDYDAGLFTDGYHADCIDNVDGDTVWHLEACGKHFRGTKSSSFLPSSSSSTTTTTNHQSGNDEKVSVVVPLTVITIWMLGVKFLMRKIRRESPQYSTRSDWNRSFAGDDHRDLEMVSITSAIHDHNNNNNSNEDISSSTAVAKEELLDGNFTFEYFNAADTDVIGMALTAYSMNNEWENVKKNLQRIRETKTCAEERAFYVKTIAQSISKAWPGNLKDDTVFSPLLDNWKRAEPHNADCRIIRAETYLSWAWHARSCAVAALVSQRQFSLFITRLRLCALELAEARKLRPDDPLIYSIGITLMKGLGNWDDNVMSVEDCLESLQRTANEPKFYHAHVATLQYYCAKWHGSHEQMFAYARSVTSDLPVGHPLWVLIPMAHFERQLIERPPSYWRRPEVIVEIKNAYLNAFPGPAETNIQAKRGYEKQMEWICRNYFAYTLAMCNLNELARRQFRLIGKRPIEGNPWGSLNGYKKFLLALGFELESPTEVPEVSISIA